jgi:NAD(P)-dependent dehydrogenase (short-subunit alcohol dehydrogenase family)
MKLRDQVAIVTGAGRNIGEEIAKLFAAEGARVAVVDMDAGRGGRVAAEIRQSGGALVGSVAILREPLAADRADRYKHLGPVGSV